MQLTKRARTHRLDREIYAAQVCGLHRIADRLKQQAPHRQPLGVCATTGCTRTATTRRFSPSPSGIEIRAFCRVCGPSTIGLMNQKAAMTTAEDHCWPPFIIARD